MDIGAKARTSKNKTSPNEKSQPKKRTTRLKSSKWYQEAARSIGIGNKKLAETGEEAIE